MKSIKLVKMITVSALLGAGSLAHAANRWLCKVDNRTPYPVVVTDTDSGFSQCFFMNAGTGDFRVSNPAGFNLLVGPFYPSAGSQSVYELGGWVMPIYSHGYAIFVSVLIPNDLRRFKIIEDVNTPAIKVYPLDISNNMPSGKATDLATGYSTSATSNFGLVIYFDKNQILQLALQTANAR